MAFRGASMPWVNVSALCSGGIVEMRELPVKQQSVYLVLSPTCCTTIPRAVAHRVYAKLAATTSRNLGVRWISITGGAAQTVGMPMTPLGGSQKPLEAQIK
uniref:Uncharacterized protein n=1 Tax=Pyrodinium bahamense TaxID=73915 RepID=A0A7S0FM04_9DINO